MLLLDLLYPLSPSICAVHFHLQLFWLLLCHLFSLLGISMIPLLFFFLHCSSCLDPLAWNKFDHVIVSSLCELHHVLSFQTSGVLSLNCRFLLVVFHLLVCLSTCCWSSVLPSRLLLLDRHRIQLYFVWIGRACAGIFDLRMMVYNVLSVGVVFLIVVVVVLQSVHPLVDHSLQIMVAHLCHLLQILFHVLLQLLVLHFQGFDWDCFGIWYLHHLFHSYRFHCPGRSRLHRHPDQLCLWCHPDQLRLWCPSHCHLARVHLHSSYPLLQANRGREM